MDTKSMSESKTLKFNALLATLTALTQVPEFSSLISPNIFMWLTIASTVGNMYLRMKTNTAIDPTK